MKLYTDKVVAAWLGVSERWVRKLRDEGVLEEKQRGLYDLRQCVNRYIQYLRTNNGNATLSEERAMLTRAKRESAEMDNALRKGELHATADVERGIKTMILNARSRFLSLPAKLAPKLASMDGQQVAIFNELKSAINETLEELSRYENVMAAISEDDENSDDTE